MKNKNNLPDTAHQLNNDDRGINKTDHYDFEDTRPAQSSESIDHGNTPSHNEGYFSNDSSYFSNPEI